MNFSECTNKNTEEILNIFKTSLSGLSQKEALLRQQKYGLNELKIRNINILEVFLRQLKSPFTYLLLAAAIVSIAVGQMVDSLTILVFILINITIGFFQEYRAEKAVFLLQKFLPRRIKVLRDSKEEIIDIKFLAQGDIVLLEAGDSAPADLRAASLQNFLIDESVLTGESAPVSKISDGLAREEKEIFKAKNIIFSGTSVVSGKASAVVIATGKDTVFGGIDKIISATRRESAYEKSILYFSKLILKIVATTIILIFIANLLLKGISDVLELILFSVALIVSILPEALPAVVTFALSEGSLKMAKQKVVVRRLSAIEDLGNIEVLCADKTGTLTQNKLSLEKIVSSNKDKCFLYGILSSGASSINDKILNPFDAALFARAPENVLRDSKKYKIAAELPFDSYRMRSAFLVEGKPASEKLLIVKGAPESIIKNCSKFSGNFDKKEIRGDVEREGREGKRVLAFAFKKVNSEKNNIRVEDEKQLTFLGYFVFEDPLKSTAKEAIELSKKLGIQIKIITGDSKEVAWYVAKKTGLASSEQDLISGEELEKMSKDDFDDACLQKTIFARISPDIKHNIIKSLQKNMKSGLWARA